MLQPLWRRHAPRILGIAACLMLAAPPAGAIVFSLRAGSPTLQGGLSAADLLRPGGTGAPPTVAFPAAALGLTLVDDIDAVSFGLFQGTEPFYSVDAASSGATGTALAAEAAAGQQAGDIYRDPFPIDLTSTNNLLTVNQDALGLTPAVGAGVTTGAAQDDIDALDMDLASLADPDGDGVPDIPVYFSLAANSPSLTTLGAGPGDILVTNRVGGPSIAVSAATMGLLPGDDVDALLYDPGVGGTLLISLTAGSPSLQALGGSGADVFAPLITPPGFLGPSLINQTISTLGLAVGDELDAFSDRATPSPGSAAPAPPSLTLLALGLLVTLLNRCTSVATRHSARHRSDRRGPRGSGA